jgi:hypothetical protein
MPRYGFDCAKFSPRGRCTVETRIQSFRSPQLGSAHNLRPVPASNRRCPFAFLLFLLARKHKQNLDVFAHATVLLRFGIQGGEVRGPFLNLGEVVKTHQ